ncbi:MAG: phage portal protein, partial [Kofleriaceae bacterium]
GAMTWPQMVRELGEDPTAQLEEIESFNKELDQRGIVLDIDPRKTTAGGQQQQLAGDAEATATRTDS